MDQITPEMRAAAMASSIYRQRRVSAAALSATPPAGKGPAQGSGSKLQRLGAALGLDEGASADDILDAALEALEDDSPPGHATPPPAQTSVTLSSASRSRPVATLTAREIERCKQRGIDPERYRRMFKLRQPEGAKR